MKHPLNIFFFCILLFFNTLIALGQESYLTLKSNSFTAKKTSFFKVGNQKNAIQRGITLVHLHSPKELEYKTFDTYGDTAAIDSLLKTVSKMEQNNAKFALLVHDSGVKGRMNTTVFLESNLPRLRALKGRQAYVMHNLEGATAEMVNDTSITVQIALKEIKDPTVYFPKETYEFEPSIDRFIAHAGGAIDGHVYTNTLNALNQNYAKGFRMFELDIIETADGHLVAAHDWNMWSRFTDYMGKLPPTLAQFKEQTIYGNYKTLDLEGINKWFKEHKDAVLVTDKLKDPIAFAKSFVDKKRLIMELFSPLSIEEASQNGIQAMISQEPLLKLKGDKLNFLEINNVKYAAVSRRIIEREKKLMKQLRDNGIRVYVYNVNFDEGKDETYVYENELGLVYGMYADRWDFKTE